MDGDYLAKTIQAYDNDPDKFVSATSSMINDQELANTLEYLPDKSLPILDVGCAFGRDSHVLTEQGYRTVGIDLSKQLLAKAKSLYPELDCKYMDIRNLKFADNSFGAVWCNAVLLHLKDDDLEEALKEIHRVLVPNGIIAASFKEGRGYKEVVEKFSNNSPRFYNFKSEEEVTEMLRKAGFDIKKSYVLNERQRFGSSTRDLNWAWVFAAKGRNE